MLSQALYVDFNEEDARKLAALDWEHDLQGIASQTHSFVFMPHESFAILNYPVLCVGAAVR